MGRSAQSSDRHRARVSLGNCQGQGLLRCEHRDCGLSELYPTMDDAAKAGIEHEQKKNGS